MEEDIKKEVADYMLNYKVPKFAFRDKNYFNLNSKCLIPSEEGVVVHSGTLLDIVGNLIMNGKLKERIKSIRSGFKSFEDARNFMDLRRVINNFVNPHQELKDKTPAEMADIFLPLGRNKLLTLIEFITYRRYH